MQSYGLERWRFSALILSAEANNEDALLGAATSAFNLGQYSAALEYFDRLPEKDRDAPGVAEMHKTAQQINEMNAFLPGLSREAKARRAASALSLGANRLQQCATQVGQSLPATPPQTAAPESFCRKQGATAQESWQNIAKHPETMDELMDHAFRNGKCRRCGLRRP